MSLLSSFGAAYDIPSFRFTAEAMSGVSAFGGMFTLLFLNSVSVRGQLAIKTAATAPMMKNKGYLWGEKKKRDVKHAGN